MNEDAKNVDEDAQWDRLSLLVGRASTLVEQATERGDALALDEAMLRVREAWVSRPRGGTEVDRDN